MSHNLEDLIKWMKVNPNFTDEQFRQSILELGLTQDEFIQAIRCKGVAPRFFAFFVDMLILLALGMGLLKYFLSSNVSFMIVSLLYYILLEWKYGATLGKMLAGIRVVKVTGAPLDFPAAFIRNLLRFIDMLPIAYLVGVISMRFSPLQQRIGDRLAKTVVVSKYSNLIERVAN